MYIFIHVYENLFFPLTTSYFSKMLIFEDLIMFAVLLAAGNLQSLVFLKKF